MVIRDPATKAARAVLIEILDLLSEYGDSVVVAGGWVPDLLPSKGIMPHVGTTDVDIILDYRRISEQGKPTLREILLNRGYRPGSDRFKYRRTVNVGTGPIAWTLRENDPLVLKKTDPLDAQIVARELG